MNDKAQECVSARINLASLCSLTGMLKEESTQGNHEMMALQLHRQAEDQGVSDIATASFDALSQKEIEFVVPAFIALDVFLILNKAQDKARQDGKQGKSDAFDFLLAAWAPIALAGAEHMDLVPPMPPEFGPTDIRPSSLN